MCSRTCPSGWSPNASRVSFSAGSPLSNRRRKIRVKTRSLARPRADLAGRNPNPGGGLPGSGTRLLPCISGAGQDPIQGEDVRPEPLDLGHGVLGVGPRGPEHDAVADGGEGADRGLGVEVADEVALP